METCFILSVGLCVLVATHHYGVQSAFVQIKERQFSSLLYGKPIGLINRLELLMIGGYLSLSKLSFNLSRREADVVSSEKYFTE